MKTIATIGFFDGVHKGHQFLFEHLRSEAAQRGLSPLIITFDTHPRAVLQPTFVPQLITSLDERKALLMAYGEVQILPFAAIQHLSAAEFMRRIKTEFGVSVLLMGYDHRFGSDRLNMPEEYRRIGEQEGIEVRTLGQYEQDGRHVSSTQIRQALEHGDIAQANDLLGRPYALSGKVVHGKGIGRTIGFPTANISPADPQKIIPKAGVYEVEVSGERLAERGFCNIDKQGIIEVHIPDYTGDLYDRPLQIRFLRFIREEKQFGSLDELQQQIKADIDSIRHPA